MKKVFSLLLMACFVCLYSCNNDDDSTPEVESGNFFISVSGSTGDEYVMLVDTVDQGSYTIGTNGEQLESSMQTWLFGGNPTSAIGLIYSGGSNGIGRGYYLDESGILEYTDYNLASTFKTYGFYDHYCVTAAGGITPASDDSRNDGITFNFIDTDAGMAVSDITILTKNITENGESYDIPCGISEVTVNGTNYLLTGLCCYDTDGNLLDDSCRVGMFKVDVDNETITLANVTSSNAISYPAGRFRSRYYSMIASNNNGDVYVFSGSYSSDKTCGALRISSGSTSFDSNYEWLIGESSSEYEFRQVYYITDDYFLLRFYNDTEPSAKGDAFQFAIADMTNKKLTWVSGTEWPSKDEMTDVGDPMEYNGKAYLPVTYSNSDPCIFIIDPETGTATKGVTITGAATFNSIGQLTE